VPAAAAAAPAALAPAIAAAEDRKKIAEVYAYLCGLSTRGALRSPQAARKEFAAARVSASLAEAEKRYYTWVQQVNHNIAIALTNKSVPADVVAARLAAAELQTATAKRDMAVAMSAAASIPEYDSSTEAFHAIITGGMLADMEPLLFRRVPDTAESRAMCVLERTVSRLRTDFHMTYPVTPAGTHTLFFPFQISVGAGAAVAVVIRTGVASDVASDRALDNPNGFVPQSTGVPFVLPAVAGSPLSFIAGHAYGANVAVAYEGRVPRALFDVEMDGVVVVMDGCKFFVAPFVRGRALCSKREVRTDTGIFTVETWTIPTARW
jgi:hypothetical protein